MSVDLKWYGAQQEAIYEQAVQVGLTACAIDIQGQAKVNLKSFPRVDTGRLIQSIGYKVEGHQDNDAIDGVRSNPKEFEAIVGTSVEYAAHVEFGTVKMRMCPFLRLAKDMRVPFLNTIFANQVIKYVAANSRYK